LPTALLVASAAALAQTPDSDAEFSFFAGVKLWANQWQIGTVGIVPVLLPNGSAGLQQIPRATVSEIKIVPLLTLGARFSKVVAAANVFPTATYDSKGTLDGDVSRSEYDLSVGYAFLPNLVASIAYKEGKQSKILNAPAASGQKIRAGLLGLSGAAPLGGNVFLYGNAAVGIGKQTSDIADAAGDTSYSIDYRIGEVGLSYRLLEGGPQSAIKSMAIAVGYRAQVLLSKGIAYGTYELTGDPGNLVPSTTPASIQKADLQTTTDGFILSLIATF